MYKVFVISDIHLETVDNYDISNFIKTPEDSNSILIVAGDVCPIYMKTKLYKFLKDVCNMFKHVLYVPGNNEFYRVKGESVKTFSNLCKELDNYSDELDNLHILSNSCVSIGEYLFCGSILWSHSEIELPKFFKIGGFTKEIYNRKNANDIKFIKRFIEETNSMNLKRVIITHYPPSKKCLKECNNFNDEYKSLYYNDLDDMFNNELVWIYGHTHYNIDKKINKTRLVSNQCGKGKNIDETFSNCFML